ncbi:MAG: Do family serine endopeptidase [Rhizobiales bacterium]|nr:Do family serine endopeptidase [Hyphomicrobiales bacterium]
MFLLSLSLLHPAAAQQVPASQGQIQLSFSPIVKTAAPAVVNVYATRMVAARPRSPFMNDPFFSRFFGNDRRGNGRQRKASSLGSGVIVDPSGIVVTNNHVIKDASTIKVVLADKREFEAEIILKDERTDLAILQINLDGRADAFPFLEFADSDRLEVGDLVLAIGNPFGVGQTVTSGIVSALARTRVGISDYQFFIQTDAAINPGNSGGALVDMNGNLVGINTAIYSRSGGSNGIGFAIPSNMVNTVVAASDLGDVVTRPWLGGTFQDVSSDIADSLGLASPFGALISGLVDDGPLARAGARIGDLILSMDGEEIADLSELGYRLATRSLGDVIALSAMRGSQVYVMDIVLMAPPETTPRDEKLLTGRAPISGATIANLSPALAQEIGADKTEGVIILSVEPGSPANRYRFKKGDILLSLNGRAARDADQIARAVSRGGGFWRFKLERDGRIVRFAIGG